MNKNLQQPFIILAIAFFLITISAFNSSHPTSGGMGRTGAPGDGTCLDCHNPASSSINGNVVIGGIPSTIDVGVTYNLSVTTNIMSGSPTKAGFQIVALLNSDNTNAGSWSNNLGSTSLKTSGGKTYFGHQPSTNFSGNSFITWNADWTAPNIPAGQTITFYAVANLCNGNNGTSGDRVKFSTFTATMSSTSDPLTCTISNLQDISCNGESDGASEIIGEGGDATYSYLWDNGETTKIALALSPGNHTATITDGLGATSTCTTNVIEPSSLTINLNTTNALCFDSNLGTATTNVSGGTSSYTYQWSTGETTSFIVGLIPGSYNVTVSDNNGCNKFENFTIDGPASALVTTINTLTNASCTTSNDGNASVITTGGTGTYSYFWPHNNGTSQIQMNLSPGTYIVETTDDNNCLNLFSITISGEDITAPVLSLTEFNTYLDTDGTADFDLDLLEENIIENCLLTNVESNIPSFTCSNLGTNDFTIVMTDDSGNSSNEIITINVIDNLAPSLTCPNDQTTNSCDPITYDLPSAVDNCSLNDVTLLAGLESGSFFPVGTTTITYSVSDLSGNVDTCSFQITINLDLENVITTTDVNCNGENNGTATISISGGTPPYNLEANNINLDSLFAGSYPIVITDSLGCTIFDTITIVQPDIIEVITNVTNVSCFNYSDGSVVFNISGGTPPYDINFTNNIDYSMLPAATYSYEIFDNNLCSFTGSVIISEPSPLIILNPIITNASTTESNDGSIQITTLGGIEPYQFSWIKKDSLISEEANLTNAFPGDYTCTVIDSNGCSFTTMTLTIDFESSIYNNSISKSISVFPNPSHGLVNIELLGLSELNCQIRIFNSNGQKQYNKSLKAINNRLEIDMSNLLKGLYFIEVKNNGKVWIEKVLLF